MQVNVYFSKNENKYPEYHKISRICSTDMNAQKSGSAEKNSLFSLFVGALYERDDSAYDGKKTFNAFPKYLKHNRTLSFQSIFCGFMRFTTRAVLSCFDNNIYV